MINRKHYLIQLVESDGGTFTLRKNCRVFKWTNHGLDKEFKTLGPAIKLATKLHNRLRNQNSTINVVEVTFAPCTPELPDGFYKPVYRNVHTI